MEITTKGRTDLADLFRLSGLLTDKDLRKTPFMAFVEVPTGIEVQLYNRATKLLDLPDPTKVMVQWAGQWRSDFFQMTVGDIRAAMAERGLLPKPTG